MSEWPNNEDFRLVNYSFKTRNIHSKIGQFKYSKIQCWLRNNKYLRIFNSFSPICYYLFIFCLLQISICLLVSDFVFNKYKLIPIDYFWLFVIFSRLFDKLITKEFLNYSQLPIPVCARMKSFDTWPWTTIANRCNRYIERTEENEETEGPSHQDGPAQLEVRRRTDEEEPHSTSTIRWSWTSPNNKEEEYMLGFINEVLLFIYV